MEAQETFASAFDELVSDGPPPICPCIRNDLVDRVSAEVFILWGMITSVDMSHDRFQPGVFYSANLVLVLVL